VNIVAKIAELGSKEVAIWLQKECNYIGVIEGDYEAYCLYPSEIKLWPETDKSEVDRCWPIIKANNFKFIGAPQDTSSSAPKQFDGYLNGITTEIKTANFKAESNEKLYTKVRKRMAEMSKQKAEQGFLLFAIESNVTAKDFELILPRMPNTLVQYSYLRKMIIAFENEKSIISFER